MCASRRSTRGSSRTSPRTIRSPPWMPSFPCSSRWVCPPGSSLSKPTWRLGAANDDPGGQRGLLPTVGLSLPLPLFNWNGGEVRQAAAARDRAQASLDLVRRETGAELARVRRGFTLALVRLERDPGVLSSPHRVAAMSLQAYAEGVVALPNVLEAQRNAREGLARYIDDVAAANNAAAAVRLLTATEPP